MSNGETGARARLVGKLMGAGLLAVAWLVLAPHEACAAAETPLALSRSLALGSPSIARLEQRETAFLHYEGNALLSVLGQGWREEHSNDLIIHHGCLWADSIVSDIEATIWRPRDLVISLTMRPHFIEGRKQPQRVDVLWNGRPVGTCQFKMERGWDFTRFDMAIPKKVQRLGVNRITFLSRYALSARDIAGDRDEKADARRVSFGLVSLQLHGPQETPVDSLAGLDLPPEEERVATFADGTILQQPSSHLKIPLRLPAAACCVLRLASDPGQRGLADGVVWLRWDSVDGPRERRLRFEEVTGGDGSWVQADLSMHAGQVVELDFDTTGRECVKPVKWPKPAIWTSWEEQAAPEQGPPLATTAREMKQVVVICLDALRASGLGHSGALRSVSPFIDSLAESGIACRRVYACATWTYPSVVSMFTGLSPLQHGVGDIGSLLSEAIPMLQERLKEAGCITGLIGENPFFAERYKLDRGFDEYHYIFPGQAEGRSRGSEEATPLAIEFLRAHVDDRFFLYLHFFPPHAPYATGNPLHQTMTHDPIEGIPPVDGRMHDAEIGRLAKSRESVKHLRARYDENVRYIDGQVSKVLGAMKELGYGEETAIIITADHGEEFDEHGHLGHSDPPYETLIRVPFIVHFGPQSGGQGQRPEAVASSLDLFPTICAWLNVEPPPGLPGRNLFGDVAPTSKGLLSFAQSQSNPPVEGYVWERYKLLRDPAGARLEIYDLKLDPGEQCNLADVRPVLADYLLAQALAWRAAQTASRPAPGTGKVETDEQAAEQLRALGYR